MRGSPRGWNVAQPDQGWGLSAGDTGHRGQEEVKPMAEKRGVFVCVFVCRYVCGMWCAGVMWWCIECMCACGVTCGCDVACVFVVECVRVCVPLSCV